MFDPRAADPVRPKYHTPILLAATIIALAAVGGGVAQAEDRGYLAGAATGSDLNEPHQTIAKAPVRGSTLHVTNGVDFGWGGQIAVGRTLGLRYAF
jgi:hypothetical protein